MKLWRQLTYLGTEVDKRVDPGLEITRRISLTMPVLKDLNFLETSECTKEMETTSLPVGLRLQTFIQPRSEATYWSNGVKVGHFSIERAEKNIKHGNNVHKWSKHKWRRLHPLPNTWHPPTNSRLPPTKKVPTPEADYENEQPLPQHFLPVKIRKHTLSSDVV